MAANAARTNIGGTESSSVTRLRMHLFITRTRSVSQLGGAISPVSIHIKTQLNHGFPAGVGCSLGNQALILEAARDLDGAMLLHKGNEAI